MSTKNRLFRSKKNRVLAGVCAGLADYFDIDPIIVRLVFLALFFAGIGFPVYLVAWIFVPSR